MPSAQTMLGAHRTLVNESKGAGLTGLAVQAQQAPIIRALQALVDADHDPRKDR
jgi:hypothetical protein